MNGNGFEKLLDRYYAQTNLRHDKSQIGPKLRPLKNLWGFTKLVHFGTGLGRHPDDTVDGSDEWWEVNTKVFLNFLFHV